MKSTHSLQVKMMKTKSEYSQYLNQLISGTENVAFDPFKDIDWEGLASQDERLFVLGETDPLGRSAWYKSLPLERQIAIGKYRWAHISKIGLQFEQILISGMMQHFIGAGNSLPEFEYGNIEARDEINHTLMFQRYTDIVSPEVHGAPNWFVLAGRVVPIFGWAFPEMFFVGILAGEEPIDHAQKDILRGKGTHPLLERIMQIHIAEEARHIGFAHAYLTERATKLPWWKKEVINVLSPALFRIMAQVILVPDSRALHEMGIPKEVADEIDWTENFEDLHADIRALFRELGLQKYRTLWNVFGVGGRPSRFRGELAHLKRTNVA